MDGIKEEPESDSSQPSSPLEEYEPIFIKTEHFEPETLPIMKCEAVVSLLNSSLTDAQLSTMISNVSCLT
jgi:hypothetical protein